jgi:hypothetical protein
MEVADDSLSLLNLGITKTTKVIIMKLSGPNLYPRDLIQIFVKTLTGKVQTYNISPNFLIEDVKQYTI